MQVSTASVEPRYGGGRHIIMADVKEMDRAGRGDGGRGRADLGAGGPS